MALILHIETATTTSSVALSEHGILIGISERNEKNLHASIITLLISEVMELAGYALSDLDAVSVSMGPGSYTGLRIGVATAKGLCYGLNIPLIGINTLQAMSAGLAVKLKDTPHASLLTTQVYLCPMIDARRMEVYMAIYDEGQHEIEKTGAHIIDAGSFRHWSDQRLVLLFGDGSEKLQTLFENEAKVLFLPGFLNSASYQVSLARQKFSLSEFENLSTFEPFYLKEFMTTALLPKS